MDATLQKTATLKIGDRAPDFTLEDQENEKVALSDFRGKKHVVLVFYPLAFTSVCALQMPGYSRERQTFDGLEAQVLAISVDSVPAHRAWAEQLGGIDFPLLSDFYPHGEVAKKYGVLRPEGYSERATIIVDRKGIVRYIDVHEIGKLPENEEIVEFLRTLK